ncbi:MAG: hypothetical protein ACMUIP_13215 [bacterium]
MVVYVGSIFILGSVLFMILAIVIACYKSHYDKVVGRFEKKGNKILTWQEIETLVEETTDQCEHILHIFYSALIDHAPINGIRYYTLFPNSMFSTLDCNDGHRKSLIAHWIGEIAKTGELLDCQVDMAVTILKHLTDPQREYFYTQLIAWNSLSHIAYCKKPLLGEAIKKEELLKSLTNKGTQSIGAQKFLFSLLTREELDAELEQGITDIIIQIFNSKNALVKALLYYKIRTSSCLQDDKKNYLLKHAQLPSHVKNYMMKIDYCAYKHTLEELTIGLKNLGISNPPYIRPSSEARIASILLDDCLLEVGMPVSLYLFNPDEATDKAGYEYISLFEKDDPRKKYENGNQNFECLFIDREDVRDIEVPSERQEEDREKSAPPIREGLSSFEEELKNMANSIANKKKRKTKLFGKRE